MRIFGRNFPLIYVFMWDKKELSYTIVFQKTNEMFFILSELMVKNFEIAIMNSTQNVFSFLKKIIFMFHFTQIIWRVINDNLQSLKYKNETVS